MDLLERYQVLTEIVREFKTAILNDKEKDKMGELILEIIQESGEAEVADYVLKAYIKRSHSEVAVRYLDQATAYLHEKIDDLLNSNQNPSSLFH